MSRTLEPNQERMQSYLDGELDDAARTEVEAAIAADPGFAAELGRMRRLRELLAAEPAALLPRHAEELAFDRVLQNIHAQIDVRTPAAQAAPAPAPTNVVPIDRARRVRRSLIGGAVAFAAAAAVAVVTLAPGSDPRHGASPGNTSVANHATGSRPAGTEIVRVEFGKSSGTFWEQADGRDRVAIVWIDDTMPSEVARP